jgi:hypothetical protein
VEPSAKESEKLGNGATAHGTDSDILRDGVKGTDTVFAEFEEPHSKLDDASLFKRIFFEQVWLSLVCFFWLLSVHLFKNNNNDRYV